MVLFELLLFDLCATTTTVPAYKIVSLQARACSIVAVWYYVVSTYCQSGISTLVNESESTARCVDR